MFVPLCKGGGVRNADGGFKSSTLKGTPSFEVKEDTIIKKTNLRRSQSFLLEQEIIFYL